MSGKWEGGCSRSNLEQLEFKILGQKCTRSSASQNEFEVFNLWGRHPKATRYYETIFILTEAISFLEIRGGPWGSPWTGFMNRVHRVVHGPGPSGSPWTRVHVFYTTAGRVLS